jgi:GT2 family glycosyltransferase
MAHGKVMYWPGACVYHHWHRAPNRSLRPFVMQLRSMFLYFSKWGFCFGFGKKAACLPCNNQPE